MCNQGAGFASYLITHDEHEMVKFNTFILSVKGLRQSNEDNLANVKLAKHTYFLAVADGMGGMIGGDFASKSVLRSVIDFLKNEISKRDKHASLKELLKKSFLVAQTCIADKIADNPQFTGMGTTLTAVLIKDGKFVWGNLGDSRIYLMREGNMRLLTEDHSYVQDYIKNIKGEMSSKIISQYKNIVTKIVDGGLDEPDINPESEDYEILKRGDTFLICSDGLIVDKTKDLSEIFADIICHNKSLRKAAKELIKWALENGSDDNISVVLGRFGTYRKGKTIDDDNTIRILANDNSDPKKVLNKDD